MWNICRDAIFVYGKFVGILETKIKQELSEYRVDARSKLGNKEGRIPFGVVFGGNDGDDGRGDRRMQGSR